MVLNRKKLECLLQVEEDILSQVDYKYLKDLFTSDGKMELEAGRRIGVASALMQALCRSVVVRRDLVL